VQMTQGFIPHRDWGCAFAGEFAFRADALGDVELGKRTGREAFALALLDFAQRGTDDLAGVVVAA